MRLLRRFYRIAAWCLVITISAMVAMSLAMLATNGRETPESLPDLVRIVLGTLGALSAVGALVLWIGMLWNCLFTSKLPLLLRIGWFALILFTIYLGALIYYFVEYRRQEALSLNRPLPSVITHDY